MFNEWATATILNDGHGKMRTIGKQNEKKNGWVGEFGFPAKLIHAAEDGR